MSEPIKPFVPTKNTNNIFNNIFDRIEEMKNEETNDKYNDFFNGKVESHLPKSIKEKFELNKNIKNDNDCDDEDGLLSIAMKLEKQEQNKKMENTIIKENKIINDNLIKNDSSTNININKNRI